MSFWSFIGLVGEKEFSELQSNVSSLLEENRLLREDNKRLFQLITDVNDKCVEKMTQQLQNEQEVLTGSILDVRSDIEKLLETLGTTHRELGELISSYDTKYDDIVNRISNHQQRVCDSISKLDREVKGICDEIQKLLGLNTGKIIENIHGAQELCIANVKSILEKINNIDSSVMVNLEKMREQDEKTVQYILKIKENLNDNAGRLLNVVDKFENIDKQTESVEEIHSTVVTLAESVQNLWAIMKLVWVDSLISDIDSLTQNEG